MNDVFNCLSDTDGTAMPVALHSANATIISTEIANESADLIASETAGAIASNPTIIAPVIAPGSTNLGC